jgi:hypothetical protein
MKIGFSIHSSSEEASGEDATDMCHNSLLYKSSEDNEGLELEITGWVLNKR